MPVSADELGAKLARRGKQKTDLSGGVKSESNIPRAQKPESRAPAPRQRADKAETLPEAPEIEKAVLGAIFANPNTGFPTFESLARKAFFASPVNREIYDRAKAFFQDNGRIDLIGFTAELGDAGRLPTLGGPGYLTDIFVSEANRGDEWLRYYIEKLSESYVRRQLIVRSFALAGKARTGDVAELLADMAGSVLDLRLASNGAKDLRDGAECLNGHRPEMPAELVRRVLHQGSKMIVGGTSKGRKTMALIDLAVSIATGSDWWGFHTKRGPVCYINFEIQDAFFWYRVEELCRAKGVSLDPGMFYAWNLRGQANAMERLTDELLSVLQTHPFVLDVIDPIYKALGQRDENKAGDVASMLNELEKIAVETEAAVAFGAHYSKGNQILKEHIDRIGGSGVFARDPDSILTMTAHEEEECFTVESTLRNFRPLGPFVLKWEWPLFQRQEEMDPTRLKKARGSGSGQFETKYPNSLLLDQLSIIHGLKPQEVIKELCGLHGMTRRTIYRMKEELEAKKVLIVKDNQWFRATKDERENSDTVEP